MSDITVINDSEQSSLVTNGLAKNGELYLKAAGSTNAGAIVVYDSGVWRTFANEYASTFNIATRNTEANILASTPTNPSGEVNIAFGTDTNDFYIYDSSAWFIFNNDS